MMDGLLESVLREITPTKKEHNKEKQLIEDVTKELEKLGLKSLLVGSLAKKTDLRGDKDIDLFILFDKSLSPDELERLGLEAGKKVFAALKADYEIEYAQHPYVVGLYKGYNVDLVPCYDVGVDEIKSAVDRTPHHTTYIKRKIRQNKKLRDSILLLKQFMKGVNVYGAETKVEGFSGYLAELLVLNYGSFTKTLNESVNWRFGEILDPGKQWDSPKEIECLFPDSDLVIIDPVDRYRNAAAAVSKQKIALFKVCAERFIDKPDRSFFYPPEIKPPSPSDVEKMIKSRDTLFYCMEFIHPKINVNSLYSQLRKTLKAVDSVVEEHGFRVMKSGYWTDEGGKSILLFEFEVYALPSYEKKLGPPADRDRKDRTRFNDKYEKTYLEDGRWVADCLRQYVDVKKLLDDVIDKRRGFGRNLREESDIRIKEGVGVLDNADVGYLIFLKIFF